MWLGGGPRALGAAALPDTGLRHLRRAFTPEAEVPHGFIPMLDDRGTAAALAPRFLDFDQEWCVKNELDPLPDPAGARRSSRAISGTVCPPSKNSPPCGWPARSAGSRTSGCRAGRTTSPPKEPDAASP